MSTDAVDAVQPNTEGHDGPMFSRYIAEQGYNRALEHAYGNDVLLTGSRAYTTLNQSELIGIGAQDKGNADRSRDVTHDVSGVEYDAYYRGNVDRIIRIAGKQKMKTRDGQEVDVARVLVSWDDLPTRDRDAEKFNHMKRQGEDTKREVVKCKRKEMRYDDEGRLVAVAEFDESSRRSLGPSQTPDRVTAYEYEEGPDGTRKVKITKGEKGEVVRDVVDSDYSPLESDPAFYIREESVFDGTKIQ